MPFTGSHPAIILPLLKLRILSVSGLLMGSMVPDFEFFIRLEAKAVYGHSLAPMFWLNIPTALICITLYHCVVRNQLISHLPSFFQKKFSPFTHFKWLTYLKSNYVKVIISILIGNLSHLFWDGFTHANALFVNQLPFLNIEFWQMPLFNILQYAFSVLGAIAILKFIVRMPNFKLLKHAQVHKKVTYWVLVFSTMLLVFYLRYDAEDYEKFTERIVFLCAGFLAGLIFASSCYHFMQLKIQLHTVKTAFETKNSDLAA